MALPDCHRQCCGRCRRCDDQHVLEPGPHIHCCQRDTPAGWAFDWVMNGATVTPYNPNADDSPAESLGNYCFDFQPTTCNGVFSFEINNSLSGVCPRTPDYWKVRMRKAVGFRPAKVS